ncbi:hypothetical protein KM043_005314 [Ampulex compressa]|nr:hypothetical protein KM043_005314 [Ampulex compressa]
MLSMVENRRYLARCPPAAMVDEIVDDKFPMIHGPMCAACKARDGDRRAEKLAQIKHPWSLEERHLQSGPKRPNVTARGAKTLYILCKCAIQISLSQPKNRDARASAICDEIRRGGHCVAACKVGV